MSLKLILNLMTTPPFHFCNIKCLLPVVIALILLFLYSLFGRIPDIDDAWIGEYVYWFAKDGYVHSELMRGITMQEVKYVVHHKLFNLNGLLFIKAFGFSLYSLKAVSLLYFSVFLVLFYFYVLKVKKLFNINYFWLSLIIIFSFPWIFKYSYLYRPEIMMMTLGFVGYILLEKYIDEKKGKFLQLFLSGLFFGLTMATHLNGLIIVASGFLLLMWNKKYHSVFGYGAGVLVAFSIYFYDLTDASAIDLWKHQFFDSPSLDSLNNDSVWIKPIYNLLNEHMRYFHDLKIIVFSVFLIFTLFVGYKYLFKNNSRLLQFAVFVAIITAVVAMHKSRQYLLLNFPYLLMLIVLTFKAIREGKITYYRIGKPKVITTMLVIFFIIFVTVSAYYNVELAKQKFSSDQNRELAVKYAGENSSNMNIIAPMTFMFNEINNFNQIQGELCYIEFQKQDSSISAEGFLAKANNFNRDLIMITPYYQELLGISAYNKGDDFENYFVIDKNEEMIVFKRKEKQPF